MPNACGNGPFLADLCSVFVDNTLIPDGCSQRRLSQLQGMMIFFGGRWQEVAPI
jgi:hypothetical protein